MRIGSTHSQFSAFFILQSLFQCIQKTHRNFMIQEARIINKICFLIYAYWWNQCRVLRQRGMLLQRRCSQPLFMLSNTYGLRESSKRICGTFWLLFLKKYYCRSFHKIWQYQEVRHNPNAPGFDYVPFCLGLQASNFLFLFVFICIELGRNEAYLISLLVCC